MKIFFFVFSFFLGEVLGFENLVFSVFEFIHGLIETPKFKKTVKKFLDELIYFLVLYMQITEDQVRIILLKYCMTLSPVSQEYSGVGVKREGRGGFKATENADRNVSAFQSIVNQKELLVIAVLYTSTLCDWVKNPSLISQPIRRNENLSRLAATFFRAWQWLHVFGYFSTNQKKGKPIATCSHFFPLLSAAACICVEIRLAHLNFLAYCNWPVLFSFVFQRF